MMVYCPLGILLMVNEPSVAVLVPNVVLFRNTLTPATGFLFAKLVILPVIEFWANKHAGINNKISNSWVLGM